MVASTVLSLATPPPLRNYRARARGALVRMLPQRARQSPLRAKSGHCKTAMTAEPRLLMLGAPATAHLPCSCDVPILLRLDCSTPQDPTSKAPCQYGVQASLAPVSQEHFEQFSHP